MRRRDFLLLAGGCVAATMAPALAAADPAFKSLLPLLIDVDGWKADKADGMTMEMGDGAMTTASRVYHRDPARIEVAIALGTVAAGMLAPVAQDMKIETADGHMITGDYKGVRAMRSYDAKQKSGGLIIALGEKAAFNVGYSNLTEDEALAFADKFDLKAIKAAAEAK